MLDSKKITNPLTVIAIFAGLAEVSGTTVLPFIAEPNQCIYMWYLMVFPVLLVLVFFITLNFNPSVLYAPSDFQDEGNYMKLFQKSSPIEIVRKFAADLDEESLSEGTNDEPTASIEPALADVKIVNYEEKVEPETTTVGMDGDSYRALVNKIEGDRGLRHQLIEKLVIEKLADDFGVAPRTQMSLALARVPFSYDAVFEFGKILILTEVKMLKQVYFPREVFTRTLRNIEHSVYSLPVDVQANVRLVLAIAIEKDALAEDLLVSKLQGMIKSYSIPTEIRTFSVPLLLDQANRL